MGTGSGMREAAVLLAVAEAVQDAGETLDTSPATAADP
jgi:hypothetical protein